MMSKKSNPKEEKMVEAIVALYKVTAMGGM